MLTGLLVAGEEAQGGLRAELAVGGQTVLEHQSRLLADAGAARIIVIAEQLPSNLALAVTRLRRDGIAVEVVRQVDEVAQRVQPHEKLLMLADGVIADGGALERMLSRPAPAILVLPDAPETRGWELIDAVSRWGGVMVSDGELVRRTARMLGEWELQSTLLRNAIQAGAERVPAEAIAVLARVDDSASAQAAEQAIGRAAARRHSSLLDRYLFHPLAQLAAPRAMAAMIDPAWLRGGSAGLLIIAALLFLTDWRGLGIGAALLSGPVDALGRHIASLSMRLRRDRHYWRKMRQAASALALVALGWNLREFGWGTLALTGSTLGFAAATSEHERWIGKPSPRPLWLADADALAWLLLPFALGSWWTTGLVAQAVYAFASLIALQRLTRRHF